MTFTYVTYAVLDQFDLCKTSAQMYSLKCKKNKTVQKKKIVAQRIYKMNVIGIILTVFKDFRFVKS